MYPDPKKGKSIPQALGNSLGRFRRPRRNFEFYGLFLARLPRSWRATGKPTQMKTGNSVMCLTVSVGALRHHGTSVIRPNHGAISMIDRRPLRHDRATRLPTPAQWAARLQKFRELVERSAELERLRERIRAIEARFSKRPTPFGR
jgi:hypothetical protein